MKKYLLILGLLCATQAHGQTFIQVAHGSVNLGAAGSVVTASFAASTIHHQLLAFCGSSTGSINPVTPVIIDTTNNVPLTSVRTQNSPAGHGWGQNVAYLDDIPGGAITISCSNVVSIYYILIIAEVANLDTRFPVDITAVNGSSVGSGTGGTSRNSGVITTAQANEYLVSFMYDDTGVRTFTVNNGFTIQDQLNSDPVTGLSGGFADKVVTSIQTGTSVDWGGVITNDGTVVTIVGFKQAFSTAPPITLINKTSDTVTGATSISKSVTNVVGSLIILACDVTANNNTISPIDAHGNSYTQIDTYTNTVNVRKYWWFAISNGAGANLIACNYSGADNGMIGILEYTGAGILDQHAFNVAANGGVAPPTSNNPITTAHVNELVVAWNSNSDIIYTNAGPGNFNFQLYQASGSGTDYFWFYDTFAPTVDTFTNYWSNRGGGTNFMFTASFVLGRSSRVPRRSVQIIY